MTYGEFGAVLNTMDNSHVAELLDRNIVLEMDGLSSSSDKVMFSEALTLYLYRHRLAAGPQPRLTNVIVLEEAHNLLLKKSDDSKESVLETSIRMVRQYGLGYIFVDQSASLLSKVAFANSYATLALSQKLRSDVQTIAGAMNLTDEQKQALNTLAVGTAVVRLADEYPEPFLVKVPLCSITEGCISDAQIQAHWAGYHSDSKQNKPPQTQPPAVPPIPPLDKKKQNSRNHHNDQNEDTHPPSPKQSTETDEPCDCDPGPPNRSLSREEIRFLSDVAARPLSTTVVRYQRLNLSRRRGNAVRESLAYAGAIERVVIATRCGQVVLYELTDVGRRLCSSLGIDPGPVPRESLEHRFWVRQTAHWFEGKGYEVVYEHPVKGNGAIDILATRPGEWVAAEVETGKSDVKENIEKIRHAGFDRIVLLATSPIAVGICQKVVDSTDKTDSPPIELLTWLDIS